MSRRNLTWLLVAIVFCWLCHDRGEQDPFARYAVEGYKKIDREAYLNVSDRDLFQGAMKGMVEVLNEEGDEYSQFLSEKRAKRMQSDISQELDGIGVVLHPDGDPPVLKVAGPPLPGKPADKAGVRENDTIVAIDGKTLPTMTYEAYEMAVDMIRGRAGDPVKLTVLHEGEEEPVTLDVVREKIEVDSLRGDRLLADYTWQYQLEQDPRIALVRLTSFGLKSYGELENLLPKLQADGMQAMILDLRRNGGGSLESAVDICGMFLPKGKLIVETRDRKDKVKSQEFNGSNGSYLNMPLAVLIDKNSASASEIVSACLQDHERAVVIGERSYGKGTVQELHPMQAGDSLLKLTCATFWRPSEKNIHRLGNDREKSLADPNWGVKPNPGFEVELDEEQYNQLSKQRSTRDRTVYDPEKGPGEDEPLFLDPVVETAVAHFQELFDQGGE